MTCCLQLFCHWFRQQFCQWFCQWFCSQNLPAFRAPLSRAELSLEL